MPPLETYLRELSEIHHSGAGVKETSYYPALANLLNELGKTLKPKVKCIIHLRSKGAGIPDGGLFTAEQLKGLREDENPLAGQLPARAVLEVKPPKDDLDKIIASAQVAKYLGKYGLVLVTNYRGFALVKAGTSGKPVKLEGYHLAEKEKEFWTLAAQPHKTAQQHSERLADYLHRVMLANAPLTTPEDVAWFLASYARDARAKVEAADLPALAAIRKALEETLGLTFEGAKGEHFFRSTLVQTLFYGVFSAWVLWHGEEPTREDDFNWRVSQYYLRVPVIQALFEQVADASKLRALGLMEILDWAGATLNRVIRAEFFASFEQGHAVQYFYEPFLQAFDPELRKDLGVWYTPPEIVQYMVARVDTVLRQELHIADGLADSRVVVLDPCAGTGAYLVETLKRIAATLRENGEGALLAGEVKRAAQERVFGFELLPAPYVVAHLQLGLLLQNLGAPLVDEERAGVFLTNALTGWEPPKEPKTQLPLFPELANERDAAEKVKREAKILVVIGNPPYNGFAGVAIAEERELTTAYRTTKRAPAPQGQGLNDLYVRFFRMAERRIVEYSGHGVVCFISNYSWLDGLSFTGMREKYIEAFNRIWIDCLNGDKYRTGKLSPSGEPDPSVFSTEFNREGIQVGTAIGLMVRREKHIPTDSIFFRHWWGKTKRAELLESLANHSANSYETLRPALNLGLPFTHAQVQEKYLHWPLLIDIFPTAFPGVKTSRDDFVLDTDRNRLIERLQKYFDVSITHAEMRRLTPEVMSKSKSFDAEKIRERLIKKGFEKQKIIRYCYRPLDFRWLYYETESGLLDRSRPEYFTHIAQENIWIEARQKQTMEHFDRGYVVHVLSDNFGNGLSSYFPLYLKSSASGTPLFEQYDSAVAPNLSDHAKAFLVDLKASAADLFYHTIAVLHSHAYRLENSGGLRQDWPRIPLPNSKEVLLASAALGKQIAALLDTESPVVGVTTGAIRSELKQIAKVEGKAPLNLAITAGWGSAGKGGITMPGKGKRIEREPEPQERVAGLGETTHDIYLNGETYWRNIPSRVWEYTIGGYQVIKKWLSYREEKLLGRPITQDEAREVRDMARRIAAIILLEAELDANYAAVKGATWVWPQAPSSKT